MGDYKPGDVGTRMEHLMDLQEMWSSGLAAMLSSESSHHSEVGQKIVKKIEGALDLLEGYLRGVKDVDYYCKLIDNLPPAEEIPE